MPMMMTSRGAIRFKATGSLLEELGSGDFNYVILNMFQGCLLQVIHERHP